MEFIRPDHLAGTGINELDTHVGRRAVGHPTYLPGTNPLVKRKILWKESDIR
jgi:hypothetical protein